MKKKSPEYYELDLQLAQAQDEIKFLKNRLEEKRAFAAKIKALAQQQRENQDLWLTPMSAFGHQIQQALRDLHGSILDNKE